MNELSRLRGSERYGACGDEATADNRRTGKSSGRKQRRHEAEPLRITGAPGRRLSFLWKSENGSFLSQEKGKNWFQSAPHGAGGRVQPPFFFLLRKKKQCCAPKKKDALGGLYTSPVCFRVAETLFS